MSTTRKQQKAVTLKQKIEAPRHSTRPETDGWLLDIGDRIFAMRERMEELDLPDRSPQQEQEHEALVWGEDALWPSVSTVQAGSADAALLQCVRLSELLDLVEVKSDQKSDQQEIERLVASILKFLIFASRGNFPGRLLIDTIESPLSYVAPAVRES